MQECKWNRNGSRVDDPRAKLAAPSVVMAMGTTRHPKLRSQICHLNTMATVVTKRWRDG